MATTTTTATTTTNVFSGEVNSVRTVLNLLKSIQMIKNIATCNIYDEGITFTVIETHRVKAIAYLRRHMFEIYGKQEGQDIPTFGINLNTLIDSLSLFGPASSPAADTCKIRYPSTGTHLEIIRDDRENDASTQCRLVTLDPDRENLELDLNDEPNLSQRAIMKVYMELCFLKYIYIYINIKIERECGVCLLL
ncbi:repair protein Rad1/Rec1/Rad17-domain-containing protein [Phascolomyces articulosus]|uniref:Repair protein Rad1/Rec1/Rad17-domain-containing protein n=1 Tax=Phascolomyces articulosus TaxID=60185 RepID=A0AAD5KRY8_9FUNG|nr:repair protein Rad1/Rec1/Rad17-domain-containing protein [Phascolomyces articulosus]